MTDRHPWVQVIAGAPQSGKSTFIILLLSLWRGYSLAIDGVCPNPPQRKHIAAWSSTWCEPGALRDAPASIVPPKVSLLACDEAVQVISQSEKQYKAVREAIFRGQHTGEYGRSIVLGTQRPIGLGTDAWNMAKRVVIFRVRGDSDLERIASLPGMTPAAMKMIPELPAGYCVVWDERDGIYYPEVPEWRR